MAEGTWDASITTRGQQARQPVIVGRLKSGRPIVRNPDGTVSTHQNIIVNFDDRHYVIPTIYGGRRVSEDEAMQIFREHDGVDPDTGQQIPSFSTHKEAVAFEKQQHELLESETAFAPKPKK